MSKLEVGENYLSIKIVGHNTVVAFKNKEKLTENHPDFVGNGVAVWISSKKSSNDNVVVEEKII